jgi:hypothetical protein
MDELDWLRNSDEDILTAEVVDIYNEGKATSPGISILVGDDARAFEIVFSEVDLKKILKVIKDNK